MPQSEIDNHADALSKKMWEPHKKLTMEASDNFAKVKRFAPEVYWNKGKKGEGVGELLGKIPWAVSDTIADEIRKCTRGDLIDCFDSVIGGVDRKR
jgi:hypothetical protein